MGTKSASVIAGICLSIVIIISCTKRYDPGTVTPPVVTTPPVTGNYKAPQLPATPFNYANTTGAIPGYLADFISQSPTALNEPGPIDNTPANNAITDNGATLGRVLFYDKLLSVNNTIACASCHHPDKAFTDGTALSEGFDGKKTRRNSMSVVNLRYFRAKKMFWDFRAADLETQVLMPIQDMIEMGMPSLNALEEKIKSVSYYPDLFKKAFGTTEINSAKIARALSQFIRSIISFNSKYDKALADNFSNFTPQELSGKLIMTKAFCTECHSDLTNVTAKKEPSFIIADNIGINFGFGSNNGLDEIYADKGLGELTQKADDQGTFKIPTLRNIALTAPYMHDGRFATLEQVIDHYSTGIKKNPNLGVQLFPGGFKFTDQQKKDIIAFLKTLSDGSLATDPKYADPFK